jgi:Mce-associated membrane protein
MSALCFMLVREAPLYELELAARRDEGSARAAHAILHGSLDLVDRAAVALKEKVARTAAEAITTLWSYTPADMDKLSERSAKYLGGDFGQQYRRYVDAIAPENKQAEVTSNTQVVAVAVESLRGSDATAIVYTNTTSATPKSNNIPSLKYLSYRLELQREGRDWRVTKMSTVTSLDLTPKL